MEKALGAPIASAHFQQLDRALAQYNKGAAEDPGNFEATLRCVAIHLPAAGRSAELLSTARSEAGHLLSSSNRSAEPVALHARAVALAVKGDLDGAYKAYSNLATHPGAGVVEKEKDRVTVRNIPALLAKSGYRVNALS